MRRVIGLVVTAVAVGLLLSPSFGQQQAGPAAGVRTEKNLTYAEVGGQKLLLDLFLPEGVKDPPLVVWIHGGGWSKGTKEGCPIRWLADDGYAVASINYRLTDVACFPAQIYDCKGAIRWLRANAAKYGYDPQRIAVAGGSAGGHLVALLGTSGGMKELEGEVGGNLDQSSRVEAVVDYFGPSDFTIMSPQGAKRPPDEHSPLYMLFGGNPAEKPDLVKLASPAQHVSADDPPLLILQGTADPLVNPKQSVHLDECYRKAGLDSTLVMIDGAKHGGPQFQDATRRKIVKEFLDKHLRGK